MKSSANWISWDDLGDLFAPFRESIAGTIKAELFFASRRNPRRSRQTLLRGWLYPPYLLLQSFFERRLSRGISEGDPLYLFVSDYAAEPGFGTIRPLLNLVPQPALVGNRVVVQRHRAELPEGMPVLDADEDLAARYWSDFNYRAEGDFRMILDATQDPMRPTIITARNLIKALLSRSYAYERVFTALFEKHRHIKGVVAHSDFSALSYMAGLCARRFGVPDFTLQHGFPTAEFFPVTASHYCLWGSRFAETMIEKGTPSERLAITGAPRLDKLWNYRFSGASGTGKRPEARRILFLSQTHSQLLSEQQHEAVVSLLSAFAHEPKREVIVRLHPQEGKHSLRRMQEALPAIRQSKGASLAEDLSRADVVLCVGSTAMLEAMILGVPVIEMRPPQLSGAERVFEPILQVSNASELLDAVNQLDQAAFRSGVLERQDALLRESIDAPGHGTEKTWGYIESITG